jgi:hypothetical protein
MFKELETNTILPSQKQKKNVNNKTIPQFNSNIQCVTNVLLKFHLAKR